MTRSIGETNASNAVSADFFAYGCLDLIDKRLSTLHTQISKKNWPLCMSHLEALTIFLLRNDAWGSASCPPSYITIATDASFQWPTTATALT